MSYINDISNYNPIKQFELRAKVYADIEVKTSEYIMLLLYIVNEVIFELYNKTYYYYIMDISSINSMFDLVKIEPDLWGDLNLSFKLLDDCKLVYLFTCARKFNIKDESCKQYRLNSWGRNFVETTYISKYRLEYECWKIKISNYFKNNYEDYFLLLKKLSFPITEDISYKIQEYNNKLKIKLLA